MIALAVLAITLHWWYLPLILLIIAGVLYYIGGKAGAWDSIGYAYLSIVVFLLACALTLGHFL